MEHTRVRRAVLQAFCSQVFQKMGVSAPDADIASEVLVAADARGIPSHGIARLPQYLTGIRTGGMIPGASIATLFESPTTLVVHAHGALGAPVSHATMTRVIDKARASGVALGCVKDSNHFGIAGYYAMMALHHNMLGIAMTNTAALGVPTFGRQVMYGTNPIAFAAPADEEGGFVLDMSTTVVTKGKIEVYDRTGQELPSGWAADKTGLPATDARTILDDMWHRVGGGLLPLGGEGELLSGYKGYGLAVMVDILTAVLCGAPFGPQVTDTEGSMGRVSHFFAAVRIDAFRDPAGFREDMDRMLTGLVESPRAEGAERIYFAGQKEQEREAEAEREGVPVLKQTYQAICDIALEYGLPQPERMAP